MEGDELKMKRTVAASEEEREDEEALAERSLWLLRWNRDRRHCLCLDRHRLTIYTLDYCFGCGGEGLSSLASSTDSSTTTCSHHLFIICIGTGLVTSNTESLLLLSCMPCRVFLSFDETLRQIPILASFTM
jgi:hypothetical protein